MTIQEYLQHQTRTINIVNWVGVACGLVTILVVGVLLHKPRGVLYASVLPWMVASAGVIIFLRRRLKCPGCRKRLQQQAMVGREPMRFCPLCGANFSAPMPEAPVNPFS